MPLRREFDEQHALLTITAWGDITFHDIRCELGDLYHEPWYSRIQLTLIDFTGVTHIEFQTSELKPIYSMALQSKGFSDHPRAIAVSGPLHYGLARIASAYADIAGISLKAFYSVGKARLWLGLDYRMELAGAV